MEIVDYLIIGIVDYILIGIFKVMVDFSGNPINRPMYTYGNPRLSKIIIFALTWPLGICIEIHSEIRMGRIKKLVRSFFMNIFLIIGLILWSDLAYLLAGKITQNYIVKIPLFIIILYFCLLFVFKMVGRGKPKTAQEEVMDMINNVSCSSIEFKKLRRDYKFFLWFSPAIIFGIILGISESFSIPKVSDNMLIIFGLLFSLGWYFYTVKVVIDTFKVFKIIKPSSLQIGISIFLFWFFFLSPLVMGLYVIKLINKFDIENKNI